jgi:hypothetical protein
MVEKIRNFKDLEVWKKGMEIVKDVYVTSSTFPNRNFMA